MALSVFEPRKYQSRDLQKLLIYFFSILGKPDATANERHAAMLYCTGAGKTPMSQAIGSVLILDKDEDPSSRLGFTHCVFSAPTEVIRDSFELYQKHSAIKLASGLIKPLVIKANEGLIDYIQNHRQPGYGLRNCHLSLTSLLENLRQLASIDPNFARRKLLYIDEAHRSAGSSAVDPSNVLHDIHELWLACGGFVLSGTATAERDDGRPVIPEGIGCRVERTLVEQMAEGFAPKLLLNEVVHVEGRAEHDAHEMGCPVDPEKIAEATVAHMRVEADRADGVLKAIVRLRSSKREKNREVLVALARALRQNGWYTFIASPAHAEHDEELQAMNQEVIQRIRAKWRDQRDDQKTNDLSEVRAYEGQIERIEDSCVDVIIGIHTLVEGFDWPICSHAYLIGIPRGMLALIQVLGRIIRLRMGYADYPAAWKDTSKLVLLTGTEDLEFEESTVQAAQMLAVCAYLETFKQWSILSALHGSFAKLKFTEAEEDAARDDITFTSVPVKKQAQILRLWAEAYAVFEKHVSRLSQPDFKYLHPATRTKILGLYIIAMFGKKAKQLPNEGPLDEITSDEIRQVFVANQPDRASKLAEKYEEEIATGHGHQVAIKLALRRLIEEFEQDTRPAYDAIEASLRSTIIALGADSIQRFGQAAQEMIQPPKSDTALKGEGKPDDFGATVNKTRRFLRGDG